MHYTALKTVILVCKYLLSINQAVVILEKVQLSTRKDNIHSVSGLCCTFHSFTAARTEVGDCDGQLCQSQGNINQ